MSESREPTVQDQDLALLARWCDARDQQAFAELVERHRDMVEGVCRRELPGPAEVDDVVQEVFISLADEADAIRGAPGPWLRTVALHRCLNHLRAGQRRRLHEGRGAVDEIAPEPREASEAEELVAACLAELGEDERDLVVQLFILGLSQAEVARRCQQPPLVVHRRSRRALSSLRQRFARRGQRIGLAALALLLAGGNQALAASALGSGARTAGKWMPLAAGLGAASLVACGFVLTQNMSMPSKVGIPAGPVAPTGGTGPVAPAGGTGPVALPGAAIHATGTGAAQAGIGRRTAQADAGPGHGFASRFLVVDLPKARMRELAAPALQALGRPLAGHPRVLEVTIDARGSLPATAWLLQGAPGRPVSLLPAAYRPIGSGREMVLTWSRQSPPLIDRWFISRQLVIDEPGRGFLLVAREWECGSGVADGDGAGELRWRWHKRERAGTPVTNAALLFGIEEDLVLLDARWRDLDPDECARWIAECPPEREPGDRQ